MTDQLTGPGTQSEQNSIEDARAVALKRLSQAAIGSGLTLEEYAERAIAIERATTDDELNTADVGLAEDQVEAHVDHHARWMVAILGATEERGRWRLSSRLRVIALVGRVKLDLGSAQPEASESVITVYAFMGRVDLIAPPGIPVELSGISLLGGKSDKRPIGPPLPSAPVIHVRVFAAMGGVGVKQRSSRRGLIEVIGGPRPQSSNAKRQDSPRN
jgi:hypothetical protein